MVRVVSVAISGSVSLPLLEVATISSRTISAMAATVVANDVVR